MKAKLGDYEKKSWLLVLCCLAAYTVVYIGRKNFSVCLPNMISDGVLTQSLGGTVGTCFLIFYAAGQFINGWLGDKIHPKYMITVGLFSAGIMNILMGLNSSGALFCVIWAVCGYSCSMLWSPIIRAVASYTTDEISQSAGATFTATIPLGTVICYLICAAALKFLSWRSAFVICGLILCAVSLILSFCFGSLKEHMTDKKTDKAEEKIEKKPGVRSIISAGLIFAAAGILFNGILKDGLDLWIPTVLRDRFISDASAVSLICTILPILNIFGAYAAKFVKDRFKLGELSVCGVMFMFSTIALGIVTAFIYLSPTGIWAAAVVTVLLAMSSASMLGANTMLLTFIPLHYGKLGRASMVTGMLNCFSYTAAAASSMAAGGISDNFGWEAAFVFFVMSSAIGAALCFGGNGSMKRVTDGLDEK